MTFYQVIKLLKTQNYVLLKHYRTYEVWSNGKKDLVIPCQNIIPERIFSKIYA